MFEITGIIAALVLAGWTGLCLAGGVAAELFGSQFWRGFAFTLAATLLLAASLRLAQTILPNWSDPDSRLRYCGVALALWALPAALAFWLLF